MIFIMVRTRGADPVGVGLGSGPTGSSHKKIGSVTDHRKTIRNKMDSLSLFPIFLFIFALFYGTICTNSQSGTGVLQDGNGCISFNEFVWLMTRLEVPADHMHIAITRGYTLRLKLELMTSWQLIFSPVLSLYKIHYNKSLFFTFLHHISFLFREIHDTDIEEEIR